MKFRTAALLMAATVLAGTGAAVRASAAGSSGPNILHFSVKTDMVNLGLEPTAVGSINASMARQGNADQQRLRISLSGLTADTGYQLFALVGDDVTSSSVASFTADAKGAATVSYMRNGAKPAGLGHVALPPSLDPICTIVALEIFKPGTGTILRSLFTAPDKWQYMVQRPMNNTGVEPAAQGKLRLKATQKSAQFKLQASDLTPNSDYELAVNGVGAQSYTSNAKGNLVIKALPSNVTDILAIRSLALTTSMGASVILDCSGLGIPCTDSDTSSAASVELGAAADFAVLAGAAVSNTGMTTIEGDLGVSAGSSVTGFPPGTVIGTQHVSDPTAAQAQLDLTTAYNDAAGRTLAPVSVAGNLGGMTLAPGLYKSTSGLSISSGDLTLDGQGDTHSTFIFQIASTLDTTAGRKVFLTNGAKAENVFWQVGTSATLGTTSEFKGTIMADQSITLNTGATLVGRALARIGAVTLDANAITLP